MNIKTSGSTRDYAKDPLEPSDAARKSIAALGYSLRVSSSGDAWALERNGFLHSTWMTRHQVEAFAAGVDRAFWCLGIDEAVYRVADREKTTDKTDKYDGPCDHCDRCKDDTAGQQHDVTMFHQHFIEWADDIMDDMLHTFNLDSKEE